MSYIYTDKIVSSEQAKLKLDKMKEIEANTKLHYKRISPTTVVYCKRKEKLEEYNKIYNKKITIDNYGR